MTSAAPQTPALCPRCGYDQRGAMATWQDRCPLAGTCVECGLQYDWIDVIDPGRNQPTWCVEYSRGLPRLVFSLVTTAALQALPWLFWRRLRMHHEPRLGRIAMYALLWLLTLYPMLAVGQAMEAQRYYRQVVNVIGFPAPPPPAAPTITEWEAMRWSAVAPWSQQSPGLYLIGGAWTETFPSPRDLLASHWVAYGNENLNRLIVLAIFWLTLLLLMPLSFALLPQTCRTAKVRWAHIVRIGLYAAAFTAPLSWCVAVWQLPIVHLPILILVAINLTWWGFACSRYLHLPRPWFIASMLTLMLLLVGTAIQYYTVQQVFLTQVMR